ncbi:MAG TPA: hypothetical protein VNK95_13610, partial [Caldilineaceae bacterium]|nr:hypothetical protein [Caldilineaceae bacterium]
MSHHQMCFRASWQRLLIWSSLPAMLLLVLLAVVHWPAALQAQSSTPTPGNRAAVFPRLIKRLPLAGEGERLRDFRRNPISGDLYVTDTGGQLYIVDGETLSVTATLPAGGDLALDPLNDRLYVYPSYDYFEDEGEIAVTVVDTARREIAGRLAGPRFVSLDPDHGRLFTGRPYSSDPTYNPVPVQIYDADSLELLDELPYYGIPLYNPRRDDLVVVARTALVVDLETYTVTHDLAPELAESPCPDCVGNDVAERAYFFGDANLLALEMHRIATGAGAGNYPEPRFFDATSLRPITDTLSMPIWRASCSSQPHLLWPIDGRRYINDYYSRYVFYWNLRVEDLAGNELAFRDGLYASFINPTTRQMLIDNGYVLALPSLLPVGQFYSFCWLDYDPESGLFFGRDGGDLLIMAERGGEPLPPAPTQEQPLPNRYVTEILPSPGYAEDGTLYVATGAQLYRSRDRGQSWARLRGGLPEYPEVQLDFAISPAFGEDQTLFAAGYARTYHGEGVLRSQDGGDTWTPLWDGLSYLRMGQVSISPRYAEDGQVAASGEFARIGSRFTPSMTGAAVYTSTN